MKSEKIYLVRCNGDSVFAAWDEKTAQDFVDKRTEEAIQDLLYDWEIDDPTPDDRNQAALTVAFEGDYYEVEEVDSSVLKSNPFIIIAER